MGDKANSTGSDNRANEVTQTSGRIDGALLELDDILQGLENRLNPVLEPESPALASVGNMIGGVLMTPLGVELGGYRDRINTATTRLHSIVNRLHI